MGMFDSFYMKAKCPHCGKEDVFEFQTKELVNALVEWKQGDQFNKYQKKIRKYAWCPEIKEGLIHNALALCTSKACKDWDKKKYGWGEGTGRCFEGDIVIKKGIVHSIINIRKSK